MRLVIDPNEMTLGDIVDFEEATDGMDLMDVLAPKPVKCKGEDECPYEHDHKAGKFVPDPDPEKKGRPLTEIQMPGGRALLALVWVYASKQEPDLTLEDAKAIRVMDLKQKGADDADPTEQSDDTDDVSSA